METDGLELLREAWDCAQHCKIDHWQMAVEIASLHLAGMTNHDLRWLVSCGLALHGEESTRPRDSRRQFRPIQSLAFSQRTCFVLTSAGREILEPDSAGASGRPWTRLRLRATGENLSESNCSATTDGERDQRLTPKWDGRTHELRLGGRLVKRFKLPAAAQELILAALEEEGWPPAVDDPLPAQLDQDPKRRLHYTVRNLNRGQGPARIRFFINGNGETIRWEIGPAARAKRAASARKARRRR